MFVAFFLIALAFLRRKVEWGTGWVWPMPRLQIGAKLYTPTISSGADDMRGDEPHRGVDVFYKRKSTTDELSRAPLTPDANGVRWGSPWFFMLPLIPILAAKDGEVWSSGVTPTGGSVVISHGRPFATYYTHMATLALPEHAQGVSVATGKPTKVKAGDIIGYVGASPLDGQRLAHLHFEVWHGGTRENAVDPQSEMNSWPTVPWVVRKG